MPFIYISEPNTVDATAVTKLIPEPDFQLTLGDSDFSNADRHPFDIILIRSSTRIGSDIKQRFPHIKSIVRVGTGLDNIDLEFCKENDIAIFNAAGANADAVSEYVVTTALYALRKLNILTEEDVMTWNRFKFRGHSMSEQRIGIIGFGNIGKLVYEKIFAFKPVQFLAYDPFVTQDMVQEFDITMTDLETVLKESTLITLHLPLIPQTKHIIDHNKLNLLQDSSIIINASRGGIVDEQALIEYAPVHNITYIADVVENEPHPRKDLVVSQNTIITPHIASLTKASEDAMLSSAIKNFLDNKPVKI